jgi:hypothetical protein
VSRARERAEAEWARVQERTETRTPIERFNDSALERLIALARWYAIGGTLAFVWLVVPVVWAFGWLGAAVCGLHAIAVAVGGWWSWWYMGNKEWVDGG